jgi:hypothetical protein
MTFQELYRKINAFLAVVEAAVNDIKLSYKPMIERGEAGDVRSYGVVEVACKHQQFMIAEMVDIIKDGDLLTAAIKDGREDALDALLQRAQTANRELGEVMETIHNSRMKNPAYAMMVDITDKAVAA